MSSQVAHHGALERTPEVSALDGGSLVGRRVGRYAVLSVIGEGGMGVVYSAFDEELDRRVAIKVLRAKHLGATAGRARIQREAQALARLSHPNVVQVYDVGEVAGGFFIAMEFVRGETLRVWQRRHDSTTQAGRRGILDMYIAAGRGLAAAHAKGIVHRDFKPDNVLVGDDGRPRVVDFGLAVGALEVGGAYPGTVGLGDALSGALTRTGTIMGTPAYMSPEQFEAAPSDARTDVFAFSAALYEALCGASPFTGVTFAERQAAVLRGEVREPGKAVPPRLSAAVLRGLARAPSERYPTIDSLLAALADDPDERRRRRLRGLGIVVAVVASVVALILCGQWVWRLLQERRAESQADRRLALAEARIDALLRAGTVDEAERVFAAFVEHPDNRERSALGAAWLGEARRALTRGDTRSAEGAFATGYAAAVGRREQILALAGLARIFSDEYRWDGLLLAVDALTRLGATSTPELDAIRLDAALGDRDLVGAAELLRGPLAGSPRAHVRSVLEALVPATSTMYQHRGLAVVADVDGDDLPELILESNLQERQFARILRATPELLEVATVDLGWGTFRAIDPGPGEAALLIASEVVGRGAEQRREAVVRRWGSGKLDELYRWPEGQIMAALGVDFDGDGALNLLVGTGPYTRRLVELQTDERGGWSVRGPSPELDRRGSDIVELLSEDLDGDGEGELVAALGPWLAYEVQVLRFDRARGELRSVARRRLGNISGASLVRRGLADAPARVEIVASKTDKYRNQSVFPPGRPTGSPSGTYVLGLMGEDTLRETAFAAAPALADGAVITDLRPLVGDLDGDGRDEIIVGRSVADERGAPERDVTVVLVSDDEGALHPAILGGALPIAALDLDGDGDDELVLSLTDGVGDAPVWIFGTGEERAPAVRRQLHGRTVPSIDDPVVARMWERAEELAQMGLLRQAAECLTTVAELIPESAGRGAALMRAGALYEHLGDDQAAAAAYVKASMSPAVRREADAAAARSLLRSGSVDAAWERAARTDVTPALQAVLASLDVAGLVVDFARPLASWWQIRQPLALRRDAARGALAVDALLRGELLSAPVRWGGGAVVLEAVLDIDQIEWAGGAFIGLLADDEEVDDGGSPLALDVFSGGGGGHHYYEFRCVSYGHSSSTFVHFPAEERAEHGGRLRIRAQLLAELGEWTCTIDWADGARISHKRRRIAARPSPSALRLSIGARGDDTSLAAIELRRLELRGVGFDDAYAAASSSRVARERLALVDGDPLGALAALPEPRTGAEVERLVELAALVRLARWSAAAASLRGLLDSDPRGGTSRSLRALLRYEPTIYGALLREVAGPEVFRKYLRAAWDDPLKMGSGDRRMLDALWSGLAELDPRGDASAELLRLRAQVAERLGRIDAARATYKAAIDALEGTAVDGEASVALRFALAELELRAGDGYAARRALAPLLDARAPDPGVVDRLRARPELASLWPLAMEP